ncbi:fimbrial biogenesis outer membrane usher protein [Pseudomonas nabeulensis]|uniref:Fimbrial biogenesis outer membrane usher protein n=1 Tax=Pseudomonas nabeulensis TaxID=2293833 RepID=A0A4Z0B7P2_9PSED|nr:fimbria/pilus outer membrane usher protein [Pseudomonas nabeulensis]TFY94218.1 fimbrial biogenesis outer membrane usher protein [Pseudomonas nabeulensis]
MNGRSLSGGLIGAIILAIEEVFAAELLFDLQAFTSDIASDVDVSRFNARSVMLPGRYRVDIIVNGQRSGRREVEFLAADERSDAQPCVDRALLEQLGVALDQDDPAESCPALNQWLPMATSQVNAATLEWSVGIPQAYLKPLARGYIDPVFWDEGITAGLLNYTFSTSHVTTGDAADRSYLGLNSGLNLGSWRLRHQGAQAWNSNTGRQPYQNTATFLQRSIAPWQAQLILGDSFSSGQILEGVRARGVTLASDERMLAPSLQGYAPVVRGMAESNATVTIRQNGYILYETTVAPGPFEIGDLYPTGYGGDLNVSVTEVDGRRTTFVVPYAVSPQLLRDGTWRYRATVGQVNQLGLRGNNPLMAQGTLAHGVTSDFTVYGGGTHSDGYTQGKVGAALGTTLGAFSLDVTGSRTRLGEQASVNGHRLGLGFSKHLPTSGTHIVLGAYRYSSPGYFSLYDALTAREQARRGYPFLARQKTRLDINISQQLGSGTLSLYGSSVAYWDQGRHTSFTLGYGSTWRRVAWNLSLQRSRIDDTPLRLSDRERSDEVFFVGRQQPGRLDNRMVLSLSLPLGGDARAPSATTSLAWDRGDRRGSQQQVGINGLLGEDASGHYGLWASRTTGQSESARNVNAYAGYRGSAGALRAGYGRSNDSAQLSLSAEGAVVAHQGGLTLSQSLGESAALVHAPNAQGARLTNANEVSINPSGYAVAPSLRPFQHNVLGLDPQGMPMDVELLESSQSVVPTLGSLALVQFKVTSGRAVVVKAARADGTPLPFAAQVFDEQGREVGVIGQASKAFVRGIADTGRLTVQWNEREDGRCYIDYQLPARDSTERQLHADWLSGRCVSDNLQGVSPP